MVTFRIAAPLLVVAASILLSGCVARSADVDLTAAQGLVRAADAALSGTSPDIERGEALLNAALAADPANPLAMELLHGLLKQRFEASLGHKAWEAALAQCAAYNAAIQNAVHASRTPQAVDEALVHRAQLDAWLEEILTAKKREAAELVEQSAVGAESDPRAEEDRLSLFVEQLLALEEDPDLFHAQQEIQAAIESCRARRFELGYARIEKRIRDVEGTLAKAKDTRALILLADTIADLELDGSVVDEDVAGDAGRASSAAQLHALRRGLENRIQLRLQTELGREAETAADDRNSVYLDEADQHLNQNQTLWHTSGVAWQRCLDELALAEKALSKVGPGVSSSFQEEVFKRRKKIMTLTAEARAGQLVSYNKWAIEQIESVREECVKALDLSGDEEDEALVSALSQLGQIDSVALHPFVQVLYNEVFSAYYNEDLDVEDKVKLLTQIVKMEKRAVSTD